MRSNTPADPQSKTKSTGDKEMIKIGRFNIEWKNVDEVIVTRSSGGIIMKATLCGGDFETLLEPLFVQPEIERKDLLKETK